MSAEDNEITPFSLILFSVNFKKRDDKLVKELNASESDMSPLFPI